MSRVSRFVPKSVYIATALFLGLTWFELVWNKPGNPTHIGVIFIILLFITFTSKFFLQKASIEVDPLHLLHHLYSKLRLTVSKPVLKNMLENISNLSNLKGMEYFITIVLKKGYIFHISSCLFSHSATKVSISFILNIL